MAVDRFQLQIEASTRGEQDLARMEAAINRFNTSAERSSTKTKALGTDMAGAGDKIRNAFANPMGAAGEAAEGLLAKLGPTGVAIGAVATGAVLAGTAIIGLARSFGNLYEQQSNNATRLGVTIREYSQLSMVSEQAGLSGDVLVGTMRGLSKTLSDNSAESKIAKDALDRLGVSATDTGGNVRPIRDLLLDIADKLGAIEDPALKAGTAIKILGRGGMETLPLMTSELRKQVQELEKAGFGWTEYSAQVGKAADNSFDKVHKLLFDMKQLAGLGASEAFLNALDPGRQSRVATQTYERVKAAQQGRAVDLAMGRMRNGRGELIGGPTGMSSERMELLGTQSSTLLARSSAIVAEAAEKAAKAAEAKAKAAAEKLAQYAENVRQYRFETMQTRRNLYLPEMPTSYGGIPLGLPGGESITRGWMQPETATFAANERAMDAARATADYQAQKLQLLTGPGGEIAAIQQSTALRLEGLGREKALGLDIFEADRQRLQITREGELQILQIQKARAAETRAAGASIFDAITASGGGGVKNYAAGLGLGTGRTIFSNLYSQVAGGMSGKLSLTSNPNSMLGKILQGTPFGADPNAQAGAVQMTAAQVQMQAAQMQMTAATGGGIGGVGSMLGLAGGGGSGLPSNVAMLNPFYKGGGMSTNAKWGLGIGAGVGAGLGVMSGIQQGGAAGALTSTASLAGGAAAILPMLSKSLALAGPIGGAIAIGATLAMAFLPDPKQARRMALEEQAKQRTRDEASGVEYAADVYGRSADYNKRDGLRVYLNVNALDAQNIIDRQADIGEAVRQALSSYPPLALDVKGAALGA